MRASVARDEVDALRTIIEYKSDIDQENVRLEYWNNASDMTYIANAFDRLPIVDRENVRDTGRDSESNSDGYVVGTSPRTSMNSLQSFLTSFEDCRLLFPLDTLLK